MGKDVFGTARFGCKVAGCVCLDYLSKIEAIAADKLFEAVPHHPRNSPEYTTCKCGHSVNEHKTQAEVESDSAPPAASADMALEKCPICASRAG
eukprot:6420193-Prymnesium_polylepis.1